MGRRLGEQDRGARLPPVRGLGDHRLADGVHEPQRDEATSKVTRLVGLVVRGS